MLGEPDDIPEHRIGHIYKLIDFGLTDDASGPELAPGRNLLAIAQVTIVVRSHRRHTKIHLVTRL